MAATLHFVNPAAAVTINSFSAANWVGGGGSRIVNDTAAPLAVNLASTGGLTSSILLANGAAGQGFRFTTQQSAVYLGVPGVTLTNTGNSADLIFDGGVNVNVADMAFLGTGVITLANTTSQISPGTLQYTGPTATSTKQLTLGSGGGQILVASLSTLTLSGPIGESAAGQRLSVVNYFGNPGILALAGTNTYTGPTVVTGRAVLSVSAISNGGVAGPLGASSSDPANLVIGATSAVIPFIPATGTLQYTGGTAATDRGATLGSQGPFTASTIEVTNAATTLTLAGQVTGSGALTKAGPGILALTNTTNNYAGGTIITAGRLRVDDVSTGGNGVLGPGNITLTNGDLQYGGPTATLGKSITVSDAGGTVEVLSPAATLTLTGTVTGNGPFIKAGPGVLILTNVGNQYAGGITVTGGRIDVGSDAQLGLAAVAVNPAGTLRYTAGAITARTFNLNGGKLEVPAGVTLTLNGAAVNGGFLRGAGTFSLGGAVLSGATTAASSTVTVVGPTSFSDFTNGGLLTVAPGLAAPATFDLVTNQGSGAITMAPNSAVNASDFQSYGLLTMNQGPDLNHLTLLTNTGLSPMYFNGGSRTFIGVPPPAGQFSIAAINLNGKNAIVAGGLFVNNGYVVDSGNGGVGTATVVADFGALVKGAGYFQNTVITQNGGKFQAGNSPGSASFGKFVAGPGGVDNYVFAIDDATGTAGPSPDALGQVSGWGLVKSIKQAVGSATTSGEFTWTATSAAKLTVAIDTLINPTTVGTDIAGPMADFDPSRSYSWPAIQWAGTYFGPTDAATLNADTAFDTSGFANPVAGTFGWSLAAADHTLSLTYTPTPVPEPGTLALVGLAASVGVWRRRVTVSSTK